MKMFLAFIQITMDYSKNTDYRILCAGAFGRLPIEMIQRIMSYLDFESLQSLVLLSSHLYHVFIGAEKLILYPVIKEQLGPDIFPIAVLRYACSREDLRDDVEKVISRLPILKPAIMLEFDQHELYIDVERYQIPKDIFTSAAAFKIASFHSLIQEKEKECEAWIAEQLHAYTNVGKDVSFRPSDKLQIQLALYAADSVRILFPGEINPFIPTIYFDREKEERIAVDNRPLFFNVVMEPRLNDNYLIMSL